MTADPLRQGLHGQIGAELRRAAEIRRRERVVDRDKRAVAMAALDQVGEVRHGQSRVGDRLEVQQPSARRECGFDGVRIRDVDEGRLDPEAPEHALDEVLDAAIDLARDDHVVAGPENGRKCGVQSGHACSEHESGFSAFNLGDRVGQGLGRRVVDARIREALLTVAQDVRELSR